MSIPLISFVAIWLLFDGQYFKAFLLLLAISGARHA